MNEHSFSQIMTVQQHILEQQRAHPTATGEFSWLLSGLTLATKIIESQVRRAGVLDVLGETGDENVQGEQVKKLDMIANNTLMRCLDKMPQDLHERTPLVLGSKKEVEKVQGYLSEGGEG